jgi:hypothetical protein
LIPAQYADHTLEYCRDALGFKFLFLVLAFFGHGRVRPFIGESESGQDFSNGSSIYSVDDVYSDLKAKNVDLVFEPLMGYEYETHELWMIFINGTKGNRVSFMDEWFKN